MGKMSGWGEKVRSGAEKWRGNNLLSKHRTMERFGVSLAVMTVLGVLLTGMVSCGAWNAGKAVMGNTALFTSEFVTSRTQVKGTVDPVYRSDDGKRALVMMNFTDPLAMSTDAADYYVFGVGLDGGRPTKIAKPLAGQIYAFGDGWLGVLLEAPDGFANQQLNLTIRAKRELRPVENDPVNVIDESFRTHDQWRVVINPAAVNVRPLRALNEDKTPSPGSIYADTVLWNKEVAARAALDKSLAAMKSTLNAISGYESQMQRTGVRIGSDPSVKLIPPALPKEIAGDSVTGMSSAELKAALEKGPADKIEGIGDKTNRARRIDTFDNGTLPNTYVLNSAATMGTGTQFPWRSRTIKDGYFEKLGTGYATISEYLASLNSQTATTFSGRDLRWELSNGKPYSSLSAVDTATAPLTELRNKASEAYALYYKTKSRYQTVELPALLVMESSLETVNTTASTAAGPKAVEFRS